MKKERPTKSIKIKGRLHKEVKLHTVEINKSIEEFVEAAIEEKLERDRVKELNKIIE